MIEQPAPQHEGTLRSTLAGPVVLALTGFAAGFLVGKALPVSALELDHLPSVALRTRAWLRSELGEVRAVLARTLEPRDREAQKPAASEVRPVEEQPFAQLPREFPYEPPASLVHTLSMHDRYEEEEPIADLRVDIVGDEHPF